MPRPATGKTPVRNLRSTDGDWLPALARTVADETTMTDVIIPVVREYGSTPPDRQLTFADRPTALPWLEASYPQWRQAAGRLEIISAGLVGEEYAGVALWLALTRLPADRRQQSRLLAGYVLLCAKTALEGDWLERLPAPGALVRAVKDILVEHQAPLSPAGKRQAQPAAKQESPGSSQEAGEASALPAATRRREREDNVAAYLRLHPGEPLRYESIAAAAGLSNQQGSIALSGLLNGGALPGLARVGRGTYRWDPVKAEEIQE